MSDSSKSETSCAENTRGSPWYPMRKWWYFNHDAGVTPCVEFADPRQMDGFQRSLAGPSWFGFMPTPMFVSLNNGAMNHHGKKIPKWKVSMDVALFSPAEISVSVRDGFLEVKGKHEERPDQHGFTARCFTRKYRLPGDADVTKVTSTLSADGVLTVEVPFAEASAPAAVIIPVKVEIESTRGEPEKHHEEEQKYSDQVCDKTPDESSSFNELNDEHQPDNCSTLLHLDKEINKPLAEKTNGNGDDLPPVDVYDEDINSLPDPFITLQDKLEIQGIREEPQKYKHEIPVKDSVKQRMAGSSAEEQEEQEELMGQHLQAADSNQNHSEGTDRKQ